MHDFANIVVVGAGAVGCYYGARLERAGEDVRFVMRGDLAVVRERGLRVSIREQEGDEEFVLEGLRCSAAPRDLGPTDLVVVALKTTANGDLESLVGPLLHDRTTILTLQNGLGSDERLARLFGAERVVGGLCFVCVNRTGPGVVRCTEPGSLSLAEFGRPAGGRVQALAAMFRGAGVRCVVGDSLEELRWRKLVWNVPFNGLAIVAGGLATDRILADPRLEAEARALMAEVVAAAAAIGHRIPAGFIDSQIALTRPMGPYRPSSLIDFEEGREVEVESIWGEAVRRAREAGADVPRMEALYAALLDRIARRG